MIDPATLLGPFAKKLGENFADRLSKSHVFKKGIRGSDETCSEKSEIDSLRAENEQLKAYIFLVLQLLNNEMQKKTKGDPDDEV